MGSLVFMFNSADKKYVGPDLNSMSQLKKTWKLICTTHVKVKC